MHASPKTCRGTPRGQFAEGWRARLGRRSLQSPSTASTPLPYFGLNQNWRSYVWVGQELESVACSRGNLKRVRDASVCVFFLSPFSSLSLQSLAPGSVPTPVPRILAPTLSFRASSREAGPSPFFPTLLPCLPKRVPNMARLTFLLVSVLALVPSLSVATVAVDPATTVAAPHSRLGRKAKVRRHDRPT